MIAIDASALARFVIKEEGWQEVAEYLRAGTTSIDLVMKEVANAVWSRFNRNSTTLDEAKIMLGALREIQGKAVKLDEELKYLYAASDISFNRGITIYDSLYIALARERNLRLLTADKNQATAADAENVETILLK